MNGHTQDKEKKQLGGEAGLTATQTHNWFINQRKVSARNHAASSIIPIVTAHCT